MRLIREALRDLRANKGRSLLAAISLFISLLSLVAVATVGTVVKDLFIADYEQIYGRLSLQEATMDYGPLTHDRLAQLVSTFGAQIGGTGGIWVLSQDSAANIAGVLEDGRSGSVTEVSTTLIAGDLDGLRRVPLLDGSWIDLSGAPYPGGLMVNQAAARMFGGVGTTLSVTHTGQSDAPRLPAYEQRVHGVISDGIPQPKIYQSLLAAAAYQPGVMEGITPTLSVHYPQGEVAAIQQKIHEVGDLLGTDRESRVVSSPGSIEAMMGSLQQMQLAFGAVSAIMLIVAIIGLLNIGLATLRERVRELSLRRALGSTRLRVFMLVMLSTLILSIAVAGVTIAIAWWGMSWYVPQLIDPASALEAPGFPIEAALYGAGAALLAGLVGGLIPAVAAARVDMMQVLRELSRRRVTIVPM